MQDQVTQLLKDAGFKLRKWCANHPRLLQGIAKEDQEIDLDFGNETNAAIKALGLTWQPKNDRFCVKTKLNTTNRITKRIVTSDLAKLFDPLGIMAPIVVTAKIFVQELWLLKLSWDESLPAELHTRWMQFREDLKCLNNFQFSRHMFNNDVPAEIQIHTFCDASEKAYGTVVYLRAILKNGTIIVRLLCSKSRVAPLKRQTLPRLELCAAVLGAQLTARVKNDLNLKDVPSFLWTDSEIVLAWINAPSASFQTFVANRVSSIQRLTPPEQWRHVSSKHNPADVISRGLQPKIFTSCTLWFYGPLFLHGKEDIWPAKYSKNLAVTEDTERKRKIPTVAAATYNCDQNMIYKINHGNSFSTLQRITAYILRFCKHARNKEVIRQDEIQLTTRELEDALIVIIQAMQAFDFKDEISDLQKYKESKRNSQFSSLAPFLDDKGIVRVGGRLDSGLLPFDTKHPMLLPYNNPLAKLLMQEVHKKHKHCGPQTLLAQMRQRFWPIKGKIMARSIVHHCVKCTRARPQLIQQVMGSLPAPRITPARPFINSGVDYCGPFWIHYKIRGKRPQKAYVAIFCCFVTKAVHIELVSDLTTESFLGALKRFIGRRGHCQNIYCDNATNFVGANNQLSELYDTIYSEGARETITKECSGHAIQFNFIPPRAPHFGGLWEAAVKSAKHLLKRSVSTASLTYEELETVLVGIEAILNSRPLTPLSSDPNDLTALTPGHFLIGEPLTAKTDVNAIPMKQTLLSRWNLVSHIKNEFWKRWSQEYLHELQYRYKWKERSSNIKVGDMVIIKEDNAPSLQWPLGRIVKTFKGNDGAIRVVEVRTASGVWKRPIHRLAPLPVEEEVDDITLKSADDESNTKSSEHEIPTKRRKTSTAMGITSLLTILLIIPLVMSEEIQINKFKSNLGIHFEEIGTAKIATSEWNFIIHYNLDPLLEEYTAFENGTLTLNHLCQQMQQRSICINTLNQFQHIQNELKSENTMLPIKRNKRAAANFIGNIANSLFGVLDSEYADQMTRTIDQVKENENHLLHLLRNQTSVIDSTINIVSQNEEIINHRLDQINNQLREITSRIRDNGEESHQLKIFQIFTSLSSQLVMMMINIQRMQATLIDVLTDTHHGKVSSLVMSSRQLKDEVKTIKAHLPSFLELPADEEDLIQLYKLMTVKGGVTDRRGVFWITLPLVDQEFYELFKMTSIPSVINNTIFTINLCAPILAVNAHRDQYLPLQSSDMESCINLRSEQFLCYNLQARYSKGSEVCSYEFGLFNNDTRPTCSLKKSDTNSTWIQMQHKNQWLYFTRYPSRLTAICGRRNLQMDLEGSGSGILSLQSGCILKQNHITIEGHNVYSTKLQTSFISFGNISEISTPMHYESLLQTFNSTHYNMQLKNLTDLHKIIADQEILELPHKLQLHTYHNSAIGYLALLLIIIIISYLIWKRKSGRSSVISKKPNPSPRHTQPESEFIVTVT